MAQYKTGTVNVTQGQALVTGNGTDFAAAGITSNHWFVGPDGVIYTIAGGVAAGQFNLSAPYQGNSQNAQPYAIHKDFHPNGQPLMEKGDLEPEMIFNAFAKTALPPNGWGSAATRDVMNSLTDTTTPDALMPRGAYGLGNLSAGAGGMAGPIPVDNSRIPFGFFSDNAAAYPAGTACGVINFGFRSGRQAQLAVNNSASLGGPTRVFARSQNNDDNWNDPVELYHTGNLNTLEFGGFGALDHIGVAFAVNTVQARVFLPISLLNTPSSLTVTSTFKLQTLAGADVASNIGASQITTALSSNKLCVVLIDGLTGLTADQPYRLMTETTTSKITVNP